MVIRRPQGSGSSFNQIWQPTGTLGALTADLMVAMAILALAVIPIGYSFWKDQHICRLYYQRAIAMQIMDAELELLRAGKGKSYPEGVHEYPVEARSLQNLPKGKFWLTRTGTNLVLEYKMERRIPGLQHLRKGGSL